MPVILPVLVMVAVFSATLWLTWQFRRYALAKGLLDRPNDRSSHAIATPRGGGVAIVLTTLAALLAFGKAGLLPWPSVLAFSGGGALVALIGFVDDHGHVRPIWRLIGHFAAALWVVRLLGGLPPMPTLDLVLHPAWLRNGLAVVYVVWLVNLTNFMDGIDGIAGVEAVTVCLGGVLLSRVTTHGGTHFLGPLALASAATGFLVWNWPPAKIFMGDAGSGFLGFMFATLSLQAGWIAPKLYWSWVIMLGVFVVDASVTLIRRVARGDKFYQAHRTHAYQHAATRFDAHLPVTLAVGAINVIWLLPIAVLVAVGALDGLSGLAVAYAPLLGLAVWLRAGQPAEVAQLS